MRVALPEFPPRSIARSSLRASLNARRRQVPPQQRLHAAQLVARNVDRALRLQSHWRIAVYAALPWELDSAPLIALAARRGCRVFLPCIDRRRASRAMRFVSMQGPLQYVRLGAGGGFYDRAFAFRQLRNVWHAPRLIGLAYAFQEVASIGAAAHDVLMDAVVTEEGFLPCTTG